MEPLTDLGSLTLHDATLISLSLEWEEGLFSIAVRGAVRPGTMGARIRWAGVTSVLIRREQPWGPSVSILETQSAAGVDKITMQSGDTIEIVGATREVELHYQAV